MKSPYGTASRRMLQFLNGNPGATSGDINKHLHGDFTVSQMLVRYRHVWKGSQTELRVQWQAKRYVLDTMMNSEYYTDVEILNEREQPLSKVCRGKFAYLLSPYCSRTLAADPEGRRTHPSAANKNSQRRWFYRVKGDDGRFRYFLTLIGMGALPKHGLP